MPCVALLGGGGNLLNSKLLNSHRKIFENRPPTPRGPPPSSLENKIMHRTPLEKVSWSVHAGSTLPHPVLGLFLYFKILKFVLFQKNSLFIHIAFFALLQHSWFHIKYSIIYKLFSSLLNPYLDGKLYFSHKISQSWVT